jgi:hypothetical protein
METLQRAIAVRDIFWWLLQFKTVGIFDAAI